MALHGKRPAGTVLFSVNAGMHANAEIWVADGVAFLYRSWRCLSELQLFPGRTILLLRAVVLYGQTQRR